MSWIWFKIKELSICFIQIDQFCCKFWRMWNRPICMRVAATLHAWSFAQSSFPNLPILYLAFLISAWEISSFNATEKTTMYISEKMFAGVIIEFTEKCLQDVPSTLRFVCLQKLLHLSWKIKNSLFMKFKARWAPPLFSMNRKDSISLNVILEAYLLIYKYLWNFNHLQHIPKYTSHKKMPNQSRDIVPLKPGHY